MPVITILDDLPPEDNAMLQALYSRSPASVEIHLQKVRAMGSGKFCDRYVVGYGHKSIADCGTATIFIEDVSMLAAKAIQDWPLYNGQEASTRYMDFSSSRFSNPIETEAGELIQESWRDFYMNQQSQLDAFLRDRHPRQEANDPKEYDRAIAARRFDILRAFIPAGASTNLSWHTNLRQASDHLEDLVNHPSPEISSLGNALFRQISAKYQHSFKPPSEDAAALGYLKKCAKIHHLTADDLWSHHIEPVRGIRMGTDIDPDSLSVEILNVIRERPRGYALPRTLGELGQIHTEAFLDFGSFRDLQRHRNGVIRMPLLTTDHGFHEWYLAELPDCVREEAIRLIALQKDRILALNCDPYTRQSYIAMGFRVPCRVTQNLPAFVYRLELRSSKTVHPTLRSMILDEISGFRKMFPGIPLHVDEDPDSWTIRRGSQTIEERK